MRGPLRGCERKKSGSSFPKKVAHGRHWASRLRRERDCMPLLPPSVTQLQRGNLSPRLLALPVSSEGGERREERGGGGRTMVKRRPFPPQTRHGAKEVGSPAKPHARTPGGQRLVVFNTHALFFPASVLSLALLACPLRTSLSTLGRGRERAHHTFCEGRGSSPSSRHVASGAADERRRRPVHLAVPS